MRNLWYFGLEPLKERYTHQLSEKWFPETFDGMDINFISLAGEKVGDSIKKGSVLDASGRGIYAMSQCQNLLIAINNGLVKNNDIIYLQDFWTPGIESIFYALDLYGIKVKLYSMLHAQSVDEYDFTYMMRHWMRHFELGIAERHSGVFVGSTIHKQQLIEAGFKCPIHVVGLPVNLSELESYNIHSKKENQVIYTSRLDKEKNPYFLLEVIKEFLLLNDSYEFVITTSGDSIRSSVGSVVDDFYQYAYIQPRLKILENLSKEEYYAQLAKSKVQFNCSLQDYVSWTLIESTFFGCDICYPNFRSFPEIIDKDRLYDNFKVNNAVDAIEQALVTPRTHKRIGTYCDAGRRLEAYIMLNDVEQEFNIWNEYYMVEKLVG
tara:strand:+ start:2403 stop:3536 length:1134 start_codon:yes stop_codon:yes gene_type:complete